MALDNILALLSANDPYFLLRWLNGVVGTLVPQRHRLPLYDRSVTLMLRAHSAME